MTALLKIVKSLLMVDHVHDKLLGSIDADLKEMIERLEHWSSINSGSAHLAGLDKMLGVLQKDFASLHADTEILTLKSQEFVDGQGKISTRTLGKALRIKKRPQANRQIFLGGHYDTVFAANHPFQKNTRIDTNTLNGPGVADMKGGLVVMLKALEILERSSHAQNIGWEILLNPDEEIGSPGSTLYFQEAAKRNHLGLIFEPSPVDGTFAGKRGGSGNFTLVVHGLAAHAGRERHLGQSAIAALAEAITALENLNGAVPGITLNVGHIEGGGPVNVVPDLAICRFNIRNQCREHAVDVSQHLERIVSGLNARDGIRAELSGGFGRAPKEVTDDIQRLFDLFQSCASEDGLTLKMKASGGVCDGNTLAAAGLANLDTLGVRGDKIHSADEFVLLNSLVERARLTARFLLKLAAGELVWK